MTSGSETSSNKDMSPKRGMGEGHGSDVNNALRRPKQVACRLCKKRMLKCDGNKASCATCLNLNHKCEYPEERKKSDSKRGQVKLLEARLEQVENLLGTRENNPEPNDNTTLPGTNVNDFIAIPDLEQDRTVGQPESGFAAPSLNAVPDFPMMSLKNSFEWSMIGLGIQEELPPQDMTYELNEIYFQKVHPSLPMVHRTRFLTSLDLPAPMRPVVCLRYAMWALAASLVDQYAKFADVFYQRSRKYAELDEMTGHGESIVTVAHCQAWTLLGCFEFKNMYFPRAWMSVGRAARLALLLGLNRQDSVGLDIKQTIHPPRDWTDREERRRTFWVAYCQDQYSSVGTGWPLVFNEQDILTNLPASEEAFNESRPEPTLQLSDLMTGEGASSLSSFGAIVLVTTLYGRNLTRLQQPTASDHDQDLNGGFWRRHRELDNILLNTSLSLPPHLRLPAGLNDPSTIFLNMSIHTATICIHQTAISSADKNHLADQISSESKRRCIVAADQITSIMKMISHMDLSATNPFLAFSLYVAARVFVQYLKVRRDDQTVKSSLHFLLAAMQAVRVKNPLTESFMVQLDVDIEGSGIDMPEKYRRWKSGDQLPGESPANPDSVNRASLFETRESQEASLGIVPDSNPKAGSVPSAVCEPVKTSSLYSTNTTHGTGPDIVTISNEGLNNKKYDCPAQLVGSASPGNGYSDGSSGSRPASNHLTPSSGSGPNSQNISFTPQQSDALAANTRALDNSTPNLSANNLDGWNLSPQNLKELGSIDMQTTMDIMHGQLDEEGPSLMPVPDSLWPIDVINEDDNWMFAWPDTMPHS